MAKPAFTSNIRLEHRTGLRRQDPGRKLDACLVAGILIAWGSAVLGIAGSGADGAYFFQPAAAALVLGVTLGVMFVTTPGPAMLHSFRCVRGLFLVRRVNHQTLMEEIIQIARMTRHRGLLAVEPQAAKASNAFLREALLLALDVKTREELVLTLETELRMKERHGEAGAKTLEVAGGFAPTIGILGTVVGLIEVLRHFSNLESVTAGIGTAFVSTIYGLALANLVLLPLAHRIRATVAIEYESSELILEGVLCIFDQVHPSLIRSRLAVFLRPGGAGPRIPKVSQALPDPVLPE